MIQLTNKGTCQPKNLEAVEGADFAEFEEGTQDIECWNAENDNRQDGQAGSQADQYDSKNMCFVASLWSSFKSFFFAVRGLQH